MDTNETVLKTCRGCDILIERAADFVTAQDPETGAVEYYCIPCDEAGVWFQVHDVSDEDELDAATADIEN